MTTPIQQQNWTHPMGEIFILFEQALRKQRLSTPKTDSQTLFFNLLSYALGAGKLINLHHRAGYP